MTELENKTVKLIDESQGRYIPQLFAKMYTSDKRWIDADADDIEVLQLGPDTGEYWEAWEQVVYKARYMDKDGRQWSLWQEGDLFVYTGNGEQWT